MTCVSSLFRNPAPSCKCKDGYTDFYDDKININCKLVEIYNEMKAPAWVWESKTVNLLEDISNFNYGKFT